MEEGRQGGRQITQILTAFELVDDTAFELVDDQGVQKTFKIYQSDKIYQLVCANYCTLGQMFNGLWGRFLYLSVDAARLHLHVHILDRDCVVLL